MVVLGSLEIDIWVWMWDMRRLLGVGVVKLEHMLVSYYRDSLQLSRMGQRGLADTGFRSMITRP